MSVRVYYTYLKRTALRILIMMAFSLFMPLGLSGFSIHYTSDGFSAQRVDTAHLNRGIRFIHAFLMKKFELKKLDQVDTLKINFISDYDSINVMFPSDSPVLGFYSPKLKECFVWLNSPKFKKTVYHESVHFFLNYYSGYHPPWLNEGLAEYFEDMYYSKALGNYVIPKPSLSGVRQQVDNGLELRKYFVRAEKNLGHELHSHPDGKLRAVYQSLVYFVMDKKVLFMQDLLLYKKYRSGADTSYKLIDMFYKLTVHSYGDNFRLFEKDWKLWLKEGTSRHALDLEPLPSGKKVNKFLRKLTRAVG